MIYTFTQIEITQALVNNLIEKGLEINDKHIDVNFKGLNKDDKEVSATIEILKE